MPKPLPDLAFEIIWLDWDQKEFARTEIWCHDLTDAIAVATVHMNSGWPPTREAHGFFVRRKEDA